MLIYVGFRTSKSRIHFANNRTAVRVISLEIASAEEHQQKHILCDRNILMSQTEQSIASEDAVNQVISHGLLEEVPVKVGVGILVGGLASIVLARGGGSGARKAITAFGAGAGLGSAWTRTNLDLEDMLHKK